LRDITPDDLCRSAASRSQGIVGFADLGLGDR
jgi:hypothetical protein